MFLELGLDGLLDSHQDDPYAEFLCGLNGAGHDGLRRVVASHGVNCDLHQPFRLPTRQKAKRYPVVIRIRFAFR